MQTLTVCVRVCVCASLSLRSFNAKLTDDGRGKLTKTKQTATEKRGVEWKCRKKEWKCRERESEIIRESVVNT